MTRCLILALTLAAAPVSAAEPVTAVAYAPDGRLLIGAGRQVVTLAADGSLADRTAWPGPVTAIAAASPPVVAGGKPGRPPLVRSSAAEFTGHKDAVYGSAVSPDGRTVATASYDRLVKLFDAATGRELRELRDHSDSVHAVAFRPDGRLLASAGSDRAVKVWNPDTGERLYTLGDSTDWVYCVAFHPSGRHLAAAGVDKSIRVWEVSEAGGTLRRAYFAHDGPVLKLAYSPDGQTLYSLAEDRVLKAWDADTGRERYHTDPLPSAVHALALSPDGKRLAIGRHDGRVELRDAATGAAVGLAYPVEPQPPALAAVTPAVVVRGTEARVVLTGRHLDAVTELTADGLTAVLDGPPAFDRLAVKLTVPPERPAGPVKLVGRSPAGEATFDRLVVDLFAESTADVRPLNSSTGGTLDRAGKTERHRYSARAGDAIGAAVTTSAFDPVVELIDPHGRSLAVGAPAVGAAAPEDGTYTVAVRDRTYRGSPAMGYRLHVGTVPVVTGVYPLGLRHGETREVRLQGVHLGDPTVVVTATAAVGTKQPVTARSPHGAVYGSPAVVVGEWPRVEAPAELPVPGTADGHLGPDGSGDCRFRATAGEPLILEIAAARFGSRIDPILEIRDADGRLVPRAVLQCVAKTSVALRDHDSQSPGVRLEAWNEFGADDWVLIGQEVIRIHTLPLGPDEDTRFYAVGGKRRTYFDTTPTAHALGAPIYKVEPYPPGTVLPSNGLPQVMVPYRNDDGGPGYGRDSRLRFTAPADGVYTARVSDALGRRGPEQVYQLTVRRPVPDFRVRVSPTDPKVGRGGAVPLTVTAERLDDFDGPIDVALADPPPGFTAPPARIDAGQTSTALALIAAPDAPTAATPISLVGRATIDGRTVERKASVGRPSAVEPGVLSAAVVQPEIVLRPGGEATFDVTIERRHGFQGRVPVEVRGLPHGVRVLHVGLNGILITERETARRVTVYAEPWVEPTERSAVVSVRHEGKNTESAAPPVPLRVVR